MIAGELVYLLLETSHFFEICVIYEGSIFNEFLKK